MCLHAGADQSQRIAGELPAGAGHGAAGQQDDHAGVCAVGAVLLQVAVLQCLRREEQEMRKEQILSTVSVHSALFLCTMPFRSCCITQPCI